MGKMKLGSPAFPGHRPWPAVWPVRATEGVRHRLDMETGRLLLDDGDTRLRHATAGKTQRSHGIEDWGAAGPDSTSLMRQKIWWTLVAFVTMVSMRILLYLARRKLFDMVNGRGLAC